MMANPITIGVAYCVTVAMVVLRIFLSNQRAVPRTLRTGVGVAIRTLLVFLLLFPICHRSTRHMVWGLAITEIVLLLSLALPLPEGFPGLNVLTVPYIVQQWLLGWPDHPRVLEPPSCDEGGMGCLERLVGSVGVASCPLRPTGTVVLEDGEYQARSDLGYVDRGTHVKVMGWQGTVLSVHPLESDLSA